MALVEKLERDGLERRAFLRLLALSLVALLPGRSLAVGLRKKRKVAYRLSTHGRRACTACKAHAANRFYKTQAAAEGDRAHPGCNCGIVSHKIKRRLAKRYFKRREVFDLRWEGTT